MAVPTRTREPLTQGGTVKLVLTAHPDGCLLLYPAPAWEPIRAQVMSFPSLDRQFSVWKRLLVGFAQDVELDGAGRLLVPPELRDFAHLTRDVMFVGPGQPLRNLGPRAVEPAARGLEVRRQYELASGDGELLPVTADGHPRSEAAPRERARCPPPSPVSEVSHVPVLLEEAVAALDIREGKTYVDGTFGRGGHSAAILARLGVRGRLLAFDQDPAAHCGSRARRSAS